MHEWYAFIVNFFGNKDIENLVVKKNKEKEEPFLHKNKKICLFQGNFIYLHTQKIIDMGKSDNGAFSTNLITSGTVINGDITCDSDMRIDGVLSGNLTAKGKIVVGKTGDVKGEISCQNCDVEGAVNGKLTIKDLLSLRATAKFFGDIITTKLAIEPGAIFTGTCKMNGEKDGAVEKK